MTHAAASKTVIHCRLIPSSTFAEVALTRRRPYQHQVQVRARCDHPHRLDGRRHTINGDNEEASHAPRTRSKPGGIFGANVGVDSSSSIARRQKYALALSDLHSALGQRDPERAYRAYESVLRSCQTGLDTWSGIASPLPLSHLDAPWRATSLAPHELRSLIAVVCSCPPKLRIGLLRLTELLSHARVARKAARWRASQMLATSHLSADTEVQEWDRLVRDPEIFAHLTGYLGRSMRSAGALEVDEALAALAEVETEAVEQSQQERSHARHIGPSSPTFRPTARIYRMLLDIVARSVPFSESFLSSPRRGQADAPGGPSDLPDPTAVGVGPGARALGLSPDHRKSNTSSNPVYHTSSTAVHLFQALWDRMRQQGIYPSTGAYTAMLNLRLRTADWDGAQKIIQKLASSHMLGIVHINAVLWTAARTPTPLRLLNMSDDQRWAALWEAYQALRWNLVQQERTVPAPPLHKLASGWNWDQLWGRHDNEELRVQPSPTTRTNVPTHTLTTPAVEQLLGLKSLPIQMVPDQVTYAQYIRTASWKGDLDGALNVLHDMLDTTIANSKPGSKRVEKQGPRYLPNIGIYDSLFRAFAKHAVPSELSHFEEMDPRATKWRSIRFESESDEAGDGIASTRPDNRSQWNVKTLMELLDNFLELLPETHLPPATLREQTRDPKCKKVLAASSPLASQSSHRRARRVAAAEKADHLAVQLAEASRAPSPRQLFSLLTALRRASNDDARWVLHQWSRICGKFSLVAVDPPLSAANSLEEDEIDWRGGREARSFDSEEAEETVQRSQEEIDEGERSSKPSGVENGTQALDIRANEEGWTAFRLDARIVRTLDFLRTRLAEAEVSGNEKRQAGAGVIHPGDVDQNTR